MITIGIDPGKSGCLCVLEDSIPIFYDWSKNNDVVNYFKLLNEVLKFNRIKLAVLEKVWAMPKQGVVSMFSFGENFGMWQSFLILTKIPHLIVPPKEWMKGLVITPKGGNTKDEVRKVVTRLYPTAELFGLKGGYKEGRGDALLIAEYARRLQQ